MQPWNTVISEGGNTESSNQKNGSEACPSQGTLSGSSDSLREYGPAVQASGTTKSECVEMAIVKKLGKILIFCLHFIKGA